MPLIFVSFHGDEDTEGGYIYYFGKDTVAVSGIKSIVERCFGLESYQGYIGDPKDVGTLTKVGEIVDDRDGSIEDYLNRQGCRYSFCVDLPMSGERSTVANRVKAVKEIGLKVISLAKEITGDNRQELTH